MSSGLGRVLPSPWPFWSLLPSSCTLPSPQAGPRLSLLWRLVGGTCVSCVFVEWRLPAPKAWMPSSDPRDGVTGGGCLCACLPSWPAPGAVRLAALGSDLFPETGTFPLKACFLTTRLSRAANSPPVLSEQGPVIRTLPCPIPGSAVCSGSGVCSALLFLTALGFSPCRYWDKEVSRAEKDSRKPSLTKAIIKCYWKSYLVLGIFTLIEVKAFMCGAWVFRVCGWGRRWAALWGKGASR